MDPNANLKEQLEILAGAEDGKISMDDRSRLLELMADLHQWIARMGFVPQVKQRGCHVCGDVFILDTDGQ